MSNGLEFGCILLDIDIGEAARVVFGAIGTFYAVMCLAFFIK